MNILPLVVVLLSICVVLLALGGISIVRRINEITRALNDVIKTAETHTKTMSAMHYAAQHKDAIFDVRVRKVIEEVTTFKN